MTSAWILNSSNVPRSIMTDSNLSRFQPVIAKIALSLHQDVIFNIRRCGLNDMTGFERKKEVLCRVKLLRMLRIDNDVFFWYGRSPIRPLVWLLDGWRLFSVASFVWYLLWYGPIRSSLQQSLCTPCEGLSYYRGQSTEPMMPRTNRKN